MLTNFIYYFNLYKESLGSRIYLIILFVSIASFFEGIGIVMLLPLLEVLLGKDEYGKTPGEEEFSWKEEVLNIFHNFPSVELLFFSIFIAFLLKGLLSYAGFSYSVYLRGVLLKSIRSKLYEHLKNQSYDSFSKKGASF